MARKSEATVEYEKQILFNSLRPHDLSPWDKKTNLNPLHFVRKKKKSTQILKVKLNSLGKQNILFTGEDKNRNSLHNNFASPSRVYERTYVQDLIRPITDMYSLHPNKSYFRSGSSNNERSKASGTPMRDNNYSVSEEDESGMGWQDSMNQESVVDYTD